MFLTLLTIVGIGAMFAIIMLFNQEWIHCSLGIECECDISHLGTLLHHLGIVYGIGRACTP